VCKGRSVFLKLTTSKESRAAGVPRLPSGDWNSFVIEKNVSVASFVANDSDWYSKYAILVRISLHFRGLIGVSLNARASWSTMLLSRW